MSPQHSNTSTIRDLYALPGLESLIHKLSPGMEMDARIVEVLSDNLYILRIWGYNILAESSYRFEKFNEVILHVRSTYPKLVFHLRLAPNKAGGALYA